MMSTEKTARPMDVGAKDSLKAALFCFILLIHLTIMGLGKTLFSWFGWTGLEKTSNPLWYELRTDFAKGVLGLGEIVVVLLLSLVIRKYSPKWAWLTALVALIVNGEHLTRSILIVMRCPQFFIRQQPRVPGLPWRLIGRMR